MKQAYEFTKQELEDLWSAVTYFKRDLNKSKNPETDKALEKLNNKLRKYLKTSVK